MISIPFDTTMLNNSNVKVLGEALYCAGGINTVTRLLEGHGTHCNEVQNADDTVRAGFSGQDLRSSKHSYVGMRPVWMV